MTVKRSGREARWAALRRRKRVGAVAETTVTVIPQQRSTEPPLEQEWNIWDLERRAREQAGDPARDQEWAALLMHLRQFANADGVLPTQFDGLVRESFSRLIQAA